MVDWSTVNKTYQSRLWNQKNLPGIACGKAKSNRWRLKNTVVVLEKLIKGYSNCIGIITHLNDFLNNISKLSYFSACCECAAEVWNKEKRFLNIEKQYSFWLTISTVHNVHFFAISIKYKFQLCFDSNHQKSNKHPKRSPHSYRRFPEVPSFIFSIRHLSQQTWSHMCRGSLFIDSHRYMWGKEPLLSRITALHRFNFSSFSCYSRLC